MRSAGKLPSIIAALQTKTFLHSTQQVWRALSARTAAGSERHDAMGQGLTMCKIATPLGSLKAGLLMGSSKVGFPPHLAVLSSVKIGASGGERCLQPGDGVSIQSIHAGKELPRHTQALQRLQQPAAFCTQQEGSCIVAILLGFPAGRRENLSSSLNDSITCSDASLQLRLQVHRKLRQYVCNLGSCPLDDFIAEIIHALLTGHSDVQSMGSCLLLLSLLLAELAWKLLAETGVSYS